MADREPTADDIRGFMEDDERRDWDSGTGTPEEREQRWQTLIELWKAIPDPTDDQLQPPYMRHEDWQVCQTDFRARENILNFYRRQWKRQRKAQGRTELEKRKRATNQPPERYEPPFETLHPFEQNHVLSKREQLKKRLKDLEIEPDRKGLIGIAEDFKKQDEKTQETLRKLVWGDTPKSAEQSTTKPGEFRDIQPSQVSPDNKPPGEFDDIRPIGTLDAPINKAIQNEPHFTVLEDSGPASRLSELLNKIPVWKEFSPWLKWGSGFFALAATMTQLGEYGWAMLALVLCGLCCLTQIAVWTASASIYKNGIWKGALFILSMAVIVTAGVTLLKIKGDKPWSNLQAHQSPVLTPTPSPTPSPLVSLLPFQGSVIQTTPSPTSTPASQLVKPNPSAFPIVVPSGFTAKPESAQLVIEGGKRQNVLAMLQAQEKYKGPGAVLQFEVLVINSEGLFAGGENVNDKTGLPITESRYWQQVDISDLYFYMQKTGRVAITFVWLKPTTPLGSV